MPQNVATVGDVTATAGPATPDGTWAAGPVQYKSYSNLTVGGTGKVIYEASCVFTYTNSSTGATAPVTVTLSASGTPLQGGLQSVLRNQDRVQDANGNTLSTSCGHNVRS